MAHAARPIPIPEGGVRRVDVMRLSSLGDVVLTLPAVHALAARFPGARLVFWVKEEFADVVRFDPWVAHVRKLESDARRIEDLVSMSSELEDADLIVDLHGNTRTRVLTFRQKAPVLRVRSHRMARAALVHARWLRRAPPPAALERYAQTLAPLGVVPSTTPRMSVGDDAERWATEWMAAWDPGAAPIVLLPGARHFTKRWPEERWIQLHDLLERSGVPILVASLEAERRALPGLVRRVAASPRARWCVEPLARLAALFSRCARAVTGDSGLMHVAAARGVPVVAMFGSTAPELGFAPAGEGHVVLCRHEPCQPCTLHGRDACPKGHFRCMIGIAADQVAERLADPTR